MFAVIRKIKSLFYDPYKHARSENRVSLASSAMLMKGCQFSFRYDGGRISIGEDSLVGCQFIVEHPEASIRVGQRCFLNAGSYLISAVELTVGDDVTMAWGVTVYDHNSHSLDWKERVKDNALQNTNFRQGLPIHIEKNWAHVKRRPIVIGDKSWIGFNVTILSGVKIGEGAVVAAGSVVSEDVPAWSVVAGNPAKAVRKLDNNA